MSGGRTRMGFVSDMPKQSSFIGPNALADEVRRAQQTGSRWNAPCIAAAVISLALLVTMSGCKPPPSPNWENDSEVQALAMRDCMDRITPGPQTTVSDNDWEDVIDSCSSHSRSVSQYCTANCAPGSERLVDVQRALRAFDLPDQTEKDAGE